MRRLNIDVIGAYGNAADGDCAAAFDAYSKLIRRWGYGEDKLGLVYTSAQEGQQSPHIIVSSGEGEDKTIIHEWHHLPRMAELRQYLEQKLGKPSEKGEPAGAGTDIPSFFRVPDRLKPWV